MNNYYECLGVGNKATAQEIKQAYRKLAKLYHPDRNKGSAQAADKFKQIHEAYETLGNEEARRAYDEKLSGMNRQPGAGAGHEQRGTKQASQEARSAAFDPMQMQAEFEQFFGFNPKSKEPLNTKKNEKASKNPLDTSGIFDRYFGFGKK